MSNASSSMAPEAPAPAAAGPAPSSHAKNRPWGMTAVIFILLAGFIVVPVIVQVLLWLAPGLLGWSEERATAWLSGSLANFLFVLLSEALTVGLVAWFVRRRKVPFRQAVALRRFRGRDTAYMVLGFLAYLALLVLAISGIEQLIQLNDPKQDIGFDPSISGADQLLAFAGLVILPPIAEEILFRGFFYGSLRSYPLPVPLVIIITSLLFSVLHLFGSAEGGLLWIAMVDTFILSIVLCYVREKTGSIWACMGIHALKNGLVFLNLFILHAV